MEMQCDMATHHGEFQRALGYILKPHGDQLQAQVTTQQSMVDHNLEFQNAITKVVAGQTQLQRLLEQQVGLMREQLDQRRNQGQGLGWKDRGPLMLPSYNGTTNADDHVSHYEAIGLTVLE